ncbi:hypothetical protein [Corynebacterium amycolatum]|nr:hypothetical protein [Corynebacterium amycolatum]MDC7116129.1 hypothetical protein [Corynebacterium amycolatum]
MTIRRLTDVRPPQERADDRTDIVSAVGCAAGLILIVLLFAVICITTY